MLFSFQINLKIVKNMCFGKHFFDFKTQREKKEIINICEFI